MSDQFNITATLDKASYNVGDTMTLTIAGGDILTQSTTATLTGTVTVQAADGAVTTVPFGPVTVNGTTSTPQSVRISSIADSDGRVWTIAADGKSATAIA